MKVDKLYDQLSSENQYRLSERVNLLKPKFPRSLFAYENRFQTVTSIISSIVGKHKKTTIFVDVGCGDGVYEKLLPKSTTSRMKSIGLDFSGQQLKKASVFFQETHKVDFDSENIPLPDKTADLILCSEVLEHLFFPEKIIKEMHRVLKPHGLLIITVPNFSSLQTRTAIFFTGSSPMVNYSKNKEHIRFYSVKDINNLLKGKFVIKQKRGISSFLFDYWNSIFKIPMPRMLQDTGDKLLPGLANGLLFVAEKLS
ncbi:MAG TPA: class I SAM-dependent methyltransferase [Candidatus Woesebacteria bacterium]|nr:class I SAM-dependent methyltransferase [Candidatus Woesebacteria bacterium]